MEEEGWGEATNQRLALTLNVGSEVPLPSRRVHPFHTRHAQHSYRSRESKRLQLASVSLQAIVLQRLQHIAHQVLLTQLTAPIKERTDHPGAYTDARFLIC